MNAGGPQTEGFVKRHLPLLRRIARFVVPPAAIIALQVLMFPIPWGLALQGVVIGLLGALIAVGMALVYRSNHVINFAQTQLGVAPTILSVSLITYSSVNYFLAAGIGLVASVLVGGIVELAIVRRFFRSSRLVLTVATIGISQLVVAAALFIPTIWNAFPYPVTINIPINWQFSVNPLVFTANHIVAVGVSIIALAAIALMLRFTTLGVSVRASAERADRASMLGVPVRRLETVVWVMASVLAFVGTFLQAGILGVTPGVGFDFTVLLAALAAMVLGDLTRLPTITVSAIALGVLQQGVLWDQINNPTLIDAVLAGIVLVALAVRRVGSSRSATSAVSSWAVADVVRTIPPALAKLNVVRLVRAALGLVALVVAVGLPWLLRNNVGDQIKATGVVVIMLVAISVVVLTGWAGQISLGQMAFAGLGGAVGAYAVATWHVDAIAGFAAAGAVGAASAVVVGLPAVRQRGFFPAITTLAFSMVCSAYLLNPTSFSWLPTSALNPPTLLGFISFRSETSLYYVAVVVTALVVLALRGVRQSRTGRVLVALRENELAAQSLGVSLVRVRLYGFAISGFIAGLAGFLYVELLGQFANTTFTTDQSILVFTDAVVGGLGSMFGAFVGAVLLQGGAWFLPDQWQVLVSGVGILIILMVAPSGIADLLYRWRDSLLAQVARRRHLEIAGFATATVVTHEVPQGAVVVDTGHPTAIAPEVDPHTLHHLVEEESGL